MNSSVNLSDEERDEATRDRIRNEHDQNFMVEAAAGTGKTSSIVDRMVNLVGSGTCEIENLVAVTFTRKAAAELRERFQAAIRKRASEFAEKHSQADCEMYVHLQSVSDNVSRAYVSTIHSFCAALLRERPIEFDIDPSFRELTEEEDERLLEQAWQQNITDLCDSDDPLIDEIASLGLDRKDLKTCFQQLIQYQDVTNWPCEELEEFDLAELKQRIQVYLSEMRELIPLFSTNRGNDQLMDRYDEVVHCSDRDWNEIGNCFRLLEKFDVSRKIVQKQWHDNQIAKEQKERWDTFREETVVPAMDWWHRRRYEFVIKFVRRAVRIYEELKTESGGLDFTDLLQTAATGLKTHPELRTYFQRQYTHLLVDEFQDTDPIQAELILYLTSGDVTEMDWERCKPRQGSLFLVGDPKQSIYRFRRGDIVTYNRVRSIFKASGGEVLSLLKNFRSRDELRTWNNRVYQDKFLSVADQYTTAAEDMVQGREDVHDGELAGVWRMQFAIDAKIEETTRNESDAIARFIRHAIDSGMTVPRSRREIDLGRSPSVEARDFLIIPRGKKHLEMFKEALDQYAIPCDVSGGNAYAGVDQLSVLIDCLRSIDDPHHAVHYLTILRHRLFGFSDIELYELKRAGGHFSYTAQIPDELDPELKQRFEDVNERMRRYRLWLRALPFPPAINRIASDLGLLAVTAAEREGNISLGGFFKAFEVLRKRNDDIDSAADLISYFDQLGESEGCTALPPDPNVVRVMNLHKAKGLQAPVVFLADTSQRYSKLPHCHIDRSGDQPAGYMSITAKKGKWGTQKIANPANWPKFQAEEQRFLLAEADRLLYVATTRAACMLVVSVGRDKSNWSGLHPFLSDVPELNLTTFKSHELKVPVEFKSEQPTLAYESGRPPKEPKATQTTVSTSQKWNDAATPSYTINSAKDNALKGTTRPNWHASGDYGYKWGSAVHELLEIAAKTTPTDLRPSAGLLANQYELGPSRVDELLVTVASVIKSDIWKRAQNSTQCFTEIPFETFARTKDGGPVITRGVIDLIFEEPQGWVIVDYKTDDVSKSDLSSAYRYYQPQLDDYAGQWQQLTSTQVVERGLYFTRVNRYMTTGQ